APMTSLKAGIIGLGVGEQHIAGYQHHPQVEVTHICDIDPAKLAEVSARHPDLQATPDPAVLLQHPDLDVLSIASYDDAHYPQIVEAIVHNKHLFVEKPLCLFPEQA